MNNKKPIYKKAWFWTVLLLFAVINIAFAIVYNNKCTNVFTAVSGWVSGIATAVLGVIAVAQNERYEKDNESFLKEQNNIQQQIAEENIKQNCFNKRLSDYNQINNYLCGTSNELLEFLSGNLAYSMKTVVFDCYERFEKDNAVAINDIGEYIENQRMTIMTMTIKIRLSHYSFARRNDLLISLYELSNVFYEWVKYGEHAADWTYLKNHLKDDIDKLFNANMKTLELATSFFVDVQTVLNYLHNDSNGFDDCNKLIQSLTNKRISDEKEIREYLKEQIIDEKNKTDSVIRNVAKDI